MYQFQIDRFRGSEALLPRTGKATRGQIAALANLIDSPIDTSLNGMALAQVGCVYLPLAGMSVTATNCAPPLVRPEATRIGDMLQCDIVLMRCGAEHGGTLDIKLMHLDEWLNGYLPWLCTEALWFIPGEIDNPLFEVAGGLFERPFAPFASAAGRSLGVERAYRALAKHGRGGL